ncbi:MAG: hypothetical protein WB676_30910 [Bryobacteraceae bacterium]
MIAIVAAVVSIEWPQSVPEHEPAYLASLPGPIYHRGAKVNAGVDSGVRILRSGFRKAN